MAHRGRPVAFRQRLRDLLGRVDVLLEVRRRRLENSREPPVAIDDSMRPGLELAVRPRTASATAANTSLSVSARCASRSVGKQPPWPSSSSHSSSKSMLGPHGPPPPRGHPGRDPARALERAAGGPQLKGSPDQPSQLRISLGRSPDCARLSLLRRARRHAATWRDRSTQTSGAPHFS